MTKLTEALAQITEDQIDSIIAAHEQLTHRAEYIAAAYSFGVVAAEIGLYAENYEDSELTHKVRMATEIATQVRNLNEWQGGLFAEAVAFSLVAEAWLARRTEENLVSEDTLFVANKLSEAVVEAGLIGAH